MLLNSNRITSVTALNSQNGQVAKSNYIYDNSNRLSAIQSSSGQLYSFDYDSFGRVTSIKIGSQELISTTYDQYSRPIVKSYGNDQCIKTVYDELDRVKEIRYNDDSSKKITYGYANNGNLAIVTDYFSGRKTVYSYDLSGRVVDVKTYSTTDLNNYSTICDWFKYGYADKTNYLVSVTHWTPEIDTQRYEYIYGDVNQGQMPDQIYSVKLNGQVIRNYTFDGLGRLQKKSTPLSSGYEVEHIYSYRDFENSNRTSTQVSSFANRLGTYSYSYDYNGNITAIAFASWDEAVAPSKTTYYSYDALGQLVDVVEGVDHYAYDYDSSGNITFNGYIYNNDESTFVEKTYTYGDNEWKDQLTIYNGQAIHYDKIGNPTYYKGANLTWSEGRRLASYNNGAYSLTFAYDSSGKRIQKTVNGMEYNYVYSGDTVIAITNVNGTNVLKFICDENGDYIGFTYGTGTYYYVRNLQNDVVAIVDANQNVLATYSYDPWGNCTVSGAFASTIGDINPIRYRGYFYDEEMGLYYLQSRYYDPDTCRFINADGAIAGVGGDIRGYNQYAYCFNNPVNMEDPNGNWPKWLSGALNVVSGVAQMVAGAALGATVGWTGVGAVAAGFLLVNGAATATQGVGQIVNSATKSNVMREDNIVRTGVESAGRAIAGDAGAGVLTFAYDAAVIIANVYAPTAQAPTVQPARPLYNLNGAKGTDYLAKRGWNDNMINNAICYGDRGTSINLANGSSCTAYRYPGTQNQYVVIETYSRTLVQLSDFNDSGWIPDSRIIWD